MNDVNMCIAGRDEWLCTREKGHDGPHVAATCDLRYSVCDVWEDQE